MSFDRKALEDEFVAKLRAAWERGASEYGDRGFDDTPGMTAEEMLEEAVDIAGWAFVFWVQLRRRLNRVVTSHEQQQQ